MTNKPEGHLAGIRELKTKDETRAHYDDWAGQYETDLVQKYGYCSSRIAAEALAERLSDKHARIIDLGCGTGLVGEHLRQRGYARIGGLDISEGMLAEAGKKNVYRHLYHGDLTDGANHLGLDPGRIGTYDAMMCVSSFDTGHVLPEHIEFMIPTIRPNGIIVLYINAIPYEEYDFPAEFERLERDGLWTVETTEKSNYMEKLDRPGWLVVARRGG